MDKEILEEFEQELIRKRGIENPFHAGEKEPKYFLFGMLNAFMNRLQAAGDQFFEEVSWKQCFTLICIGLFENPPTINEVARMIGTSHQNIKQILLKLEKMGFVEFRADDKDRRKQRIYFTERQRNFEEKYSKSSDIFMQHLYKGIGHQELEVTIRTLLKMEANLNQWKEANPEERLAAEPLKNRKVLLQESGNEEKKGKLV